MRILGAIVVVLILAGLGLYWLLQPPAPLPTPDRGGVFDHVTVIQPGESRREGQTIAIADAAIGAITPSDGEAKGPYAGMYVLPGLVNMHVHHPPQNIPVAQDLANLATLEAVVADGRLYTTADLDARFARLKAQWSNPIVDAVMAEAVRMAMARFREGRD